MFDSQQHKMRLEKIRSSGDQEWGCPICGRRLLIRWQPKFEMIELQAGDGSVEHYGSTSDNLRIGRTRIRPVEEPVVSDELRAALEEALADIDFGDW